MCWRMTTFGKIVTQTAVKGFELVGLVPKGTHDVGEALKTAADALVAGGKEKLFTPMMVRSSLLGNRQTIANTSFLPAVRLREALCLIRARLVTVARLDLNYNAYYWNTTTMQLLRFVTSTPQPIFTPSYLDSNVAVR